MIEKQTLAYWQSTIDEIYLDTMRMVHPGKNIDQGIKEAYAHLLADPSRLNATEPSDFKRLLNGWLANKSFPKKSIQKVLHDFK